MSITKINRIFIAVAFAMVAVISIITIYCNASEPMAFTILKTDSASQFAEDYQQQLYSYLTLLGSDNSDGLIPPEVTFQKLYSDLVAEQNVKIEDYNYYVLLYDGRDLCFIGINCLNPSYIYLYNYGLYAQGELRKFIQTQNELVCDVDVNVDCWKISCDLGAYREFPYSSSSSSYIQSWTKYFKFYYSGYILSTNLSIYSGLDYIYDKPEYDNFLTFVSSHISIDCTNMTYNYPFDYAGNASIIPTTFTNYNVSSYEDLPVDNSMGFSNFTANVFDDTKLTGARGVLCTYQVKPDTLKNLSSTAYILCDMQFNYTLKLTVDDIFSGGVASTLPCTGVPQSEHAIKKISIKSGGTGNYTIDAVNDFKDYCDGTLSDGLTAKELFYNAHKYYKDNTVSGSTGWTFGGSIGGALDPSGNTGSFSFSYGESNYTYTGGFTRAQVVINCYIVNNNTKSNIGYATVDLINGTNDSFVGEVTPDTDEVTPIPNTGGNPTGTITADNDTIPPTYTYVVPGQTPTDITNNFDDDITNDVDIFIDITIPDTGGGGGDGDTIINNNFPSDITIHTPEQQYYTISPLDFNDIVDSAANGFGLMDTKGNFYMFLKDSLAILPTQVWVIILSSLSIVTICTVIAILRR